MRQPAWTYDAQARAGYLRFSDELARVTRRLNDVVLVDLDADENLVGIEILDVDPGRW